MRFPLPIDMIEPPPGGVKACRVPDLGDIGGYFPGYSANRDAGRHDVLCPFRCGGGANLCASGSLCASGGLLRRQPPPHEGPGLGGGQARFDLGAVRELPVAGLVSGQGQLGPALDAALGVDPLDVRPDRERRDEQALGDLLVRQPQAQQAEHPELALGERVDAGHGLFPLADLLGLALPQRPDVVAVPVLLPQEIVDLVLDDRADEGPRRRPAVADLAQRREDGEMDLGDDVFGAGQVAHGLLDGAPDHGAVLPHDLLHQGVVLLQDVVHRSPPIRSFIATVPAEDEPAIKERLIFDEHIC
ncbi:MAG: hypothetical protein MZV63_66390 [Marinilabiliales bacterium]|nr:hypothetical protein [Marinilabiliales bacterium]